MVTLKKLISVCLAGLALSASASAAAWELRVCAAPDNYPVSSQQEPGFENLIAQVLADELGATLAFEWLVLNNQTVAYGMNAGSCDVAMGVADGAGGLISTISYYQSPYVLVFREDGPDLTGALDDPQLQELRIATYPNSLSDNALRLYGLGDQLVHVEPVARNLAHDYTQPALEALQAGTIDVAMLEGARAGHFVLTNPGLRLEPVSPLIVGPLMQLYRISTIAVRAGDESLRDQLNIALANRWDEIQGILSSFGVPSLPLSQPALPVFPEPDSVIGVVLPTRSQVPAETDAAARAARDGARMGFDLAAAARSDLNVHLRLASAPSPEAAARAAGRLAQLDGADLLVGGIGAGQTEAIMAVAEASQVPFLNLAAPPADPGEYTFSLVPDSLAFLSVLLEQAGIHDWFVIAPEALLDPAVTFIRGQGGQVAGTEAVDSTRLIYFDLLPGIETSGASAVLLLTANPEQEQFLTQAALLLPDMPVFQLTDLAGQSREFLLRWRTSASAQSANPRVHVWEPTAPAGAELTSRFMGRTGTVFEPAAWLAHAAVTIAYESLASVPEDPYGHLLSGANFTVGKSEPVSFDPESRQLQQELHVISIDPVAQWSLSVGDQLELGNLLDIVRP